MMHPKDFQRTKEIPDGDGNVFVIQLPEPPERELIDNWDKPVKEQRWRPPSIPNGFNLWGEDQQVAYVGQELMRRRNGYWFYNNGNIEYMTGLHYFYCGYWKIDSGYPDWRDADRDFFYVWDYCAKDTNCYGLLYICDRRSGKTWKGTTILYADTSTTREVNAGIQSKNDGDAEKIFEKMISSWRKLPDFFKPLDSGAMAPKKALRFSPPSAKSTKQNIRALKGREYLESVIDYKPSNEYAYDGSKLFRLYHDEVGKKSNANPYNRWLVCKPCLEVGDTIVGKAYLSSTVEETDREGGEPIKKLWDKSNFATDKLDGNGRTESGLYRYFKPATIGLQGFIDEYGYSVVEDPKEPIQGIDGKMITIGSATFIQNRRKGKTGTDLNSERRKYPFNIQDAFVLDSRGETFPSHKIYEQKDYNDSSTRMPWRIGNFVWEDSNRTSVVFRDDPNGRWKVAWMPDASDRNRYEIRGGQRCPLNETLGGIGVDPFDHNTTVDKRNSNGAIAVFRKFTPLAPNISNCFVCLYLARPETSLQFYDDVVKTATFYGYKALVENQKIGCINFMRQQGYYGYVKRTKHNEFTKTGAKTKMVDGISMAGDMAREALVDGLHLYIYDFIGRIAPDIQISKIGIPEGEVSDAMFGFCPFDELLDDWLHFEVDNWTKYDATVASGLAKLCVQQIEKVEANAGRKPNVGPLFNVRSARSGRIMR